MRLQWIDWERGRSRFTFVICNSVVTIRIESVNLFECHRMAKGFLTGDQEAERMVANVGNHVQCNGDSCRCDYLGVHKAGSNAAMRTSELTAAA